MKRQSTRDAEVYVHDPFRTDLLRDYAATFRRYKSLSDESLARVDDEQLVTALDPESNSLALLVKHMAGNLRSRWTDMFDSDGEKPDRNRDSEFERAASDTRADLMRAWEDGWSRAFTTLDSLRPEDLDRTVHIRGEPHTLVQALNRQLTHAAYHAGQIVMLAKHFRSDDWESLSIPKKR